MGELGITKVLLEEATDKGVVAFEVIGVYDTADGGTGAAGRSVCDEEDAGGPPKRLCWL